MFRIETALDNNSNLWSFNQETNQLEFAYKDDILSEYQALFKNIFPDINTDPSTPQGQIITSLTQTDLATISYLENLANAFFLGGNGYFLDLWAWNLFRVTRKQGIPSSALITIQGVAGTEIPEDFLISDNQYNYKISQSVIIPNTGTIDVLFYCTEINEFIANPNTITQIVTIVNGVERVNNTNMATPAILKETDGELFQRCVYFGSTARNASFRSILANVAEVIGVNRIAGAENVTNNPLEVSGVTLTPHSICLVVDGGENEDIANAMFNSRATGCDMVGDT
ncbi:TPA: baseplate J/gp47 family protein, partial [Campylobacter jejuni]|nr:baseplate J/gp47 family protein [Campylobacter jejuni]